MFVPKPGRRPLVLEESLREEEEETGKSSFSCCLVTFIPGILTSISEEIASITPTTISTFRIPQFGSVVIPAFPEKRAEDGYMSSLQMRHVFTVFRRDLLQLLGVPPLPETLCRANDQEQGDLGTRITPWQFSSLLRTHVQATTVSAVDTLTSISRLVSRIREMRVGKEVVGDVESSVDALTEAFAKPNIQADEGLMGVWEKTKRASALADRAFFNPSMVGLLYFVSSGCGVQVQEYTAYNCEWIVSQPDEHKYAVYAPLFAPISVPVIVAIIKELKRWRKKRKTRAGQGVAVNSNEKLVVSRQGD